MKSPRAWRAAAALVALVHAVACPPASAPCGSAADCQADAICVAGTCRRACNSNTDCGAGERCLDGACLPGSATAPDGSVADAQPVDRVADDLSATDRALADRRFLDGTAPDLGAPDAAGADSSPALDAAPPDAWSADAAGVPDVSAPDQWAAADAAGADAAADAAEADSATGVDSASPDAIAVDAWAEDAAIEDAAGTDRTVCLPGYADPDGDCHTSASAIQVCYVGSPPDGVCVSPQLQSQARPAPGSASSSGGGTAWANPENVLASDNATASVSLSRLGDSEELHLTGLGFTIPGGAVLSGVLVEVDRAAGNATPVVDQDVRLLRNGGTIGSSLASTTPWPEAMTTATYGSAFSLWGRNWSVSDLNNSGFGVSLKVRSAGGAADPDAVALVEAIRIRVFFRFDCDDSDASIHHLLYRDGDGDGRGVEPATCVAPSSGWVDRLGDCDDDDASGWRAAYRDNDGDGYGAGALLCVGDEPGYATLGTDCMDSKASVRPGQGQYFTVHRGDGSFDYNCDGAETKRADCLTTAALVACQNADILDVNLGWVNTVPGCGATGTYRGCIESIDSVCSDSEFDGVRACSATQDCSMFGYNEIRDFSTPQPCH